MCPPGERSESQRQQRCDGLRRHNNSSTRSSPTARFRKNPSTSGARPQPSALLPPAVEPGMTGVAAVHGLRGAHE
jgi:hypothetical protein